MYVKIFACLFLFVHSFLFSIEDSETNRILYLAQTGKVSEALNIYKQKKERIGKHDFSLLEKLGLIILDQGFKSPDPEIQFLTYFASGISLNEKTLRYLEEGLKSPIPQHQLVCLNLLSRYQNDFGNHCIYRAMSSNNLGIRLEAAYILAEKKDLKAVAHIESLMNKVPDELLPLFSILFSLVDSPDSTRALKKFLIHSSTNVRVASIHSLTKTERDDFIPYFRRMITHSNFSQQEACATALGKFKDDKSVLKLENLLNSNHESVKVAALQSLIHLGHSKHQSVLECLAKEGNLYAIAALANCKNVEDLLFELMQDGNPQIKINAALSLLELQDSRCLPIIKKLLTQDNLFVLLRQTSPGLSLHYWKATSSPATTKEEQEIIAELTLSVKEDILDKAANLAENSFLELAEALFASQQTNLIPQTTILLMHMQTEKSVNLLKKYVNCVGVPLTRNFCNLALYRLREKGPYANNLKNWLLAQQQDDLIKFREFLPWELREKQTRHELNPKETSQLLLETIEAFVESGDEDGFDTLLQVIENGNPKNRYALAGFLLRASQ